MEITFCQKNVFMRVQIQSLSHHIPGPFQAIELLYGFRILLVESINTYQSSV